MTHRIQSTLKLDWQGNSLRSLQNPVWLPPSPPKSQDKFHIISGNDRLNWEGGKKSDTHKQMTKGSPKPTAYWSLSMVSDFFSTYWPGRFSCSGSLSWLRSDSAFAISPRSELYARTSKFVFLLRRWSVRRRSRSRTLGIMYSYENETTITPCLIQCSVTWDLYSPSTRDLYRAFCSISTQRRSFKLCSTSKVFLSEKFHRIRYPL